MDGSVTEKRVRMARLVAVLTGLAGFILAIATPLMPVAQTTSTLNWPQGEQATSVEAPLISYLPHSLEATLPCQAFAELPEEGGIRAATIPPGAPDATRFGMQVRATSTDAQVIIRNGVVASVPRDRLTACDTLDITIDKDAVTTEFTGVTDDDEAARTVREGMFMPQVVGIFTDLD
ncbi:arabinosyltransferase, partial [Hoyosella sp. G463]|nr:arabinosyltransferase [Lolliginicoccus lacisalsi]